jgi:uracil-DNA glycosylase
MFCCFHICDLNQTVPESSAVDLSHIKLADSWKQVLAPEFNKKHMQGLRDFLVQEKSSGKRIYPPGDEIFNALNSTDFDDIKVVVLGQDPYHGAGQAHGLCFSVKPGVDVPPSLANIYKELLADLAISPVHHGCLSSWASQGVLLLNSVLTVQAGNAASHQGKGWEQFTGRIVKLLNEKKENLVFILWGNYAQKKGAIIDRNRHLVLESPHPSPLSAHRGFFNNKHFSKANAYLAQTGQVEINWQLPEVP